MTSVADKLASLVPDTVVGGVTGWVLQLGRMPPGPDKVVVFSDTGGTSPWPHRRIDFRHVQLRVRGDGFEYTQAYEKCLQVRDQLLGITSQDIGDGDRLVSVTILSDIGLMGYDDQDRPEFSVNFRVIFEPGTGEHREPL